jgi:hypothetical protein
MSKQETLEAILALQEAFKRLNELWDGHIALCAENNKKAA